MVLDMVKDIRAEHIQRLLNKESKRLSKKTLSRLKVILNDLFNQAYKNKIIKKNPVPLTQFPKYPPEKERRVMTRDEQKILRVFLKSGMTEPRRERRTLCLVWLDAGVCPVQLLRWQIKWERRSNQ